MKRFLILLALTACGGIETKPIDPDALGVDAFVPDARPEFFGEPCTLAAAPAVATCHCSRTEDGHCYEPQGFCVDEKGDGVGVCRPWCDQVSPNWNPTFVCTGAQHGGRTWFTSNGTTPNKPYVCVCLPPA